MKGSAISVIHEQGYKLFTSEVCEHGKSMTEYDKTINLIAEDCRRNFLQAMGKQVEELKKYLETL